MRIRPLSLVVPAIVAASCSSAVDPNYPTGSLLVANASNGWIDVDVDGRRQVTGLSMNAMTYSLSVSQGIHMVRVSHGGVFGGAIEVPVDVQPDAPQTLVVYPTFPIGTSPAISAMVLTDTGAYAPGGRSRLRAAHLATTAGNSQLWWRQPGQPTGAPVLSPFPYRTASAYLEGGAGVWEVWLAAPGSGPKLLSSGPIQIPSGERRTVLLVDTEEGPRFVVMGL
jgi:hypothetical protein